jgi:hypothetical protein
VVHEAGDDTTPLPVLALDVYVGDQDSSLSDRLLEYARGNDSADPSAARKVDLADVVAVQLCRTLRDGRGTFSNAAVTVDRESYDLGSLLASDGASVEYRPFAFWFHIGQSTGRGHWICAVLIADYWLICDDGIVGVPESGVEFKARLLELKHALAGVWLANARAWDSISR